MKSRYNKYANVSITGKLNSLNLLQKENLKRVITYWIISSYYKTDKLIKNCSTKYFDI